MKAYLRVGDDYLAEAKPYRSIKQATMAFREVSGELARLGQFISGSIHLARNSEELVEYPDYILERTPRGVLIEKL
jgi:hypothetical protein